MEWTVYLVLPTFTIGTISLGLVLHTIKQMKTLEKRIEGLEGENK